jgi:mRNA-degrading endonuclease HigB of HigAB toxin-antitoxin module
MGKLVSTGQGRIVTERPCSILGVTKYRLVIHVAYRYRRVLVKFIGTHAEYDRIDAATV